MPLLPGFIPADDVAPRGTKAWRQQVVRNRQIMGNQLWQDQARSGLDLSNPDALAAAMGRYGITNEVGGGRHLYNLFMGNLPSEGFGMSSPQRGISYALEAYMPDWKQFRDRAVQGGMHPGYADNAYFPWSGWNTPGGPTDPMRGYRPGGPGVGVSAPAPAASASAEPIEAEDSEDETMGMLGEDPFRRRRKGLSLSSLTSFGGQDAVY